MKLERVYISPDTEFLNDAILILKNGNQLTIKKSLPDSILKQIESFYFDEATKGE